MRIIFEVGVEPFHLLNKHGGAILFLVIASLALAPLASLYVLLAVAHTVIAQGCGGGSSEPMAGIVRALQVCSDATLYYSLFFPFLLGIFSTHMSYRMLLEGQLTSYSSPSRPRFSAQVLQKHLHKNSMVSGIKSAFRNKEKRIVLKCNSRCFRN